MLRSLIYPFPPTHSLMRELGTLGSLSLAQQLRQCLEPCLRLSGCEFAYWQSQVGEDRRSRGPYPLFALDLGLRRCFGGSAIFIVSIPGESDLPPTTSHLPSNRPKPTAIGAYRTSVERRIRPRKDRVLTYSSKYSERLRSLAKLPAAALIGGAHGPDGSAKRSFSTSKFGRPDFGLFGKVGVEPSLAQ